MSLRVIGAGFGRTGTLSLKYALEHLGMGPCYHMVELTERPQHARLWAAAAAGRLDRWDRMLGDYRSTVDWPGCHFWAELAAAYPEAKVILTVRDADSWYRSARETIFRAALGPWRRKLATLAAVLARPYGLPYMIMLGRIMWNTFDGRMSDPEHAKAVFRRHNESVRASIDPDRLLVYDVAQGWEPLCDFLGVDVPAVPFPHVNDTAEFNRTFRDRFRLGIHNQPDAA